MNTRKATMLTQLLPRSLPIARRRAMEGGLSRLDLRTPCALDLPRTELASNLLVDVENILDRRVRDWSMRLEDLVDELGNLRERNLSIEEPRHGNVVSGAERRRGGTARSGRG